MGTESQDVINSFVNVGEHIAEVCDQWHRMGLTPPCYGEYLNWLEFDYINWDQPWWNKKANESSFLSGRVKPSFRANFDFIMKCENINKILEGNFSDTSPPRTVNGSPYTPHNGNVFTNILKEMQ